MDSLTELPNIGIILSKKLHQIGVQTQDDLIHLGSENAIVKISTLPDSGACINMLYALEGAIQGIRWHHLSKERKKELLDFYRQLEIS